MREGGLRHGEVTGADITPILSGHPRLRPDLGRRPACSAYYSGEKISPSAVKNDDRSGAFGWRSSAAVAPRKEVGNHILIHPDCGISPVARLQTLRAQGKMPFFN